MSDTSLDKKKAALIGKVDEAMVKAEKKRLINSVVYTVLVLAGIGLSVGAAVSGFLDVAKVAGILAVVAAASVSVESAFKFGEKRDFFRIVSNEYQNLKVALEFRVNNEQDFQLIVDKFQIVNATLAKSMPRGKGMDETKSLYENLDRQGILPVPEVSSPS